MEKNNLLNIVQEIKKIRVQEMDSSHVEKQYILSYNDRILGLC